MSVLSNDKPFSSTRPFLVRRRTAFGLLLFFLVLPIMLFTYHSWPERSLFDFSLETLGFGLVMAGVLGRLWCTLYIGGRKADTLQCTGPYSIVRHPLYVSNFLLMIGFAFLCENLFVFVVVAGYFLLQYNATIRHEEAQMLKNFGDAYRAYMREVPRFIPNPLKYNATPPESVDLPALRTAALNSLVFLALIPLLQFIDLLHEMGVLPYIKFP